MMNRSDAVRVLFAATLLAGCASESLESEALGTSTQALELAYPARTATFDVALPPVPAGASGIALAARDFVKLGDGDSTPAAVASGGYVLVADLVRAGDVIAAGDIRVGALSHLGTLEAGGTTSLGPGSTSTSRTASPARLHRSIIHDSVDIPAASRDIVETVGPSTTLAPGSYGTVILAPLSTTTLVAGTYFFRSFDALPRATLAVSGAAPVFVYVTDQLVLGANVDDGGDATRLRVFYSGSSGVPVSSFRGTLVAPSAPVSASGDLVGFFYGLSLDCAPVARIAAIPSPLTGVAPPRVAASAPVFL